MDWDLPAIVLNTRPYGEGDVIVTLVTREHGAHRGLARGGASRAQGGMWQAGNFVQARWLARMSDQLGGFRGELIHATAAAVMDDALALAMLSSACALAEDALPEREPHEAVFAGLVALLPRLVLGETVLPELISWETVLLADLGFGLDLTSCAVSGATDGLAFVSPKTGRAVTAEGAGPWSSRLLRLPPFLTGGAASTASDWRDGLRLTGHFLARDVFGARHRPLPMARQMLYDRVVALADDSPPAWPDDPAASAIGTSTASPAVIPPASSAAMPPASSAATPTASSAAMPPASSAATPTASSAAMPTASPAEQENPDAG